MTRPETRQINGPRPLAPTTTTSSNARATVCHRP
jgi:hypothetical protein